MDGDWGRTATISAVRCRGSVATYAWQGDWSSFSTGLRPGLSGVQISSGTRNVFFCETSVPVVRPTQLPLPEVKRPYRDVDHLPLSNTDVQREWSCTLLPLYAFIMWTGTMCLYLSFFNGNLWLWILLCVKTEGGARDAVQTRYWFSFFARLLVGVRIFSYFRPAYRLYWIFLRWP